MATDWTYVEGTSHIDGKPDGEPDHFELFAKECDVPYVVTCNYQSMEKQEKLAKLDLRGTERNWRVWPMMNLHEIAVIFTDTMGGDPNEVVKGLRSNV